jgi:hypothetical protein
MNMEENLEHTFDIHLTVRSNTPPEDIGGEELRVCLMDRISQLGVDEVAEACGIVDSKNTQYQTSVPKSMIPEKISEILPEASIVICLGADGMWVIDVPEKEKDASYFVKAASMVALMGMDNGRVKAIAGLTTNLLQDSEYWKDESCARTIISLLALAKESAERDGEGGL